MYHGHARATGFSFRNFTVRKIDGVAHERCFVCSKDEVTGIKIKENEWKNDKRKLVLAKRCGCDAHERFKLDIYNGDVFVKQHVVSHNHTLTRMERQYLQRSKRITTLKETMKDLKMHI